MNKSFANTKLFITTYFALVLPALYLTESGIIENGLSLSAGSMPSIVYVLSMAGIGGLCLMRGAIINRKWLVAIPAVAFAFDLMPSFTAMTAIPYLYHALAILLGATYPSVAPTDTWEQKTLRH